MSPSAVSLIYREATVSDVPALERSRSSDLEYGPADSRIASYLERKHHPQHALPPRVAYVALEGEAVVGYVAGHLTRRYDCDGELQYLWTALDHRRSGVATRLVRMLAQWFIEREAVRICVDVGNPVARPFYTRHGAEALNPHWLVWRDVGAALAL